MKIKKAVFPVAGLGTRFIPATKAMAKEMLPVVDKPIIQYAVEEAFEAGIEHIIFVTGRGKKALEDHFDRSFEIEHALKEKGKLDLLKQIQELVPKTGTIIYTRQNQPLGLGHAIWCARDIVGDEPFAVLLADDLIQTDKPVLSEMIKKFDRLRASIVAVMEVDKDQTDKYGILDARQIEEDIVRIDDMFEKEGIPFQVADKKKLFEIEGIKQLITLCREMAQSADIPDELKDCDSETWLKFLCEKEGLNKMIQGDDKAQQAFEILLSIAGLHNDLKSFLNALVLNQDADTLEFNVEKVSLMTLHAAKGLEFPVVFVAGCEQGLVPFAKDGKNIDNIEEERRLFYVAMTRAMDILCLTYAKKRSIYGKSSKRQRSIFIKDIEKKLTQVEKSFVHLKAGKKEKQLELF